MRSRSCATGEAQTYKGSDGNILNGASGGFPRREGTAGAATSGTRSLKTAALTGRGKKEMFLYGSPRCAWGEWKGGAVLSVVNFNVNYGR